MPPKNTSAITMTTQCPQCHFYHAGDPGIPCATCEARAAAGPLLVTEQRKDWVPHTAHLHFPAAPLHFSTTTPTPETSDTQPEAIEEPASQEDSALEPPALPASARPRRQARPPQTCAYEPCGRLFTPKNAGQRFHSLRCSARWRVAQDAGKAQLQRATAAHTRTTCPPAPDPFVVQVRAELTAIETSVATLRTHLEAQHAALAQYERQAECLRQYLALTEEP